MRIFLIALLAALCAFSFGQAQADDPIPIVFQFSLDTDATVSAGVYDADGRLVRTLFSLEQLPAGEHNSLWDGLDDLGRNLPAGDYEVRLAIGGATYDSIGVIGNNGIGTTMQSATEDVRVDRETGEIYTANTWEEAGQDFKRESPDGTTLMQPSFRARNRWGKAPGGMPISITFDDDYVYAGIYTCREEYEHVPGVSPGGQIIRKFTKDKGESVKFTKAEECIRVHYPDPEWESPWGHESLRSMALLGDTLIVADEKFDRVLKYDKNSGELTGQFAVKAPRSLNLDDQNRLWMAYDINKIGVFDVDGNKLAETAHQAEQIVCMRLDGKGNLWLADQQLRKIQVYKIESLEKLTLQRTYGRKPQGDPHPNDLYKRIRFDVMPDGGYVLTQSPGHGCIEARFDADGNRIWQQVGLEFCTNGTYDQARPNVFVSSLLNAYNLTDLKTGDWKFLGNIGAGLHVSGVQSSGNPRFIKLNGYTFYYVLRGDQAIIFRYESGQLIPATMLGFGQRAWNEDALGKMPEDQRNRWFIWRDTDENGRMQLDEVVKHEPTFNLYTFSMDVDEGGNLIVPNHSTKSVYEIPLEGVDDRGIPIYKFDAAREVVPSDPTFRDLKPMKALRTPEGNYYVLASADRSYYSTEDFSNGWELCWMGGWTMSKYDKSGKRLFTVPLPDHCTGFDWIPNADRTAEQGFIAGQFTAKNLYHYSKDGLLLGKLHPAHRSGWLDHNGAMSINRNPNDGRADVFAEESLCNRISWYRMDDSNVRMLRIALTKAPTVDETSTEADLYALIEAAQAKQAERNYAAAAQLLEKALAMATPLEVPFVRLQLGEALLRVPERRAEGIEQIKTAAANEGMDPQKRADLLIKAAQQQMYIRQYDEGVVTLTEALDIPVPKNRYYDFKITLEIGRMYLRGGKYDEAMREADKALELAPKKDSENRYLGAHWLKGNVLLAEKKFDEAISLLKGLRENRIARVDHLTSIEEHIADAYARANRFEKAAEVCTAALQKYPEMPMYMKPGFMLRTADYYFRAGDKARAVDYCQKLLDLKGRPNWAEQEVQKRLEKWQ